MRILGLIVEYNPFHQGHIRHITMAKEKIKPDLTVAVMSGNFVQRGEPAIISKFDRANIAIEHGIDVVIELPLVYSVQSANQFAHGAIKLLDSFQVTDIVFGSESGDMTLFKSIAGSLKDNDRYHEKVRELLKDGISYSDACNQALVQLDLPSITTPNDLLGLAYTKEVLHNFDHINIDCITRSTSYHEKNVTSIPSATALRIGLKNNQDLEDVLINPEYFYQDLYSFNALFPYLKYALISLSDKQLAQFHLVEEGIENLMLKNIMNYQNMESFVNSLTSKRYSRSRIQRTIIHILLSNTDLINQVAKKVDYVRVLKANHDGFAYLRKLRKTCPLTIITNLSSHNHPALDLELKGARLLTLISKQRDSHIRELANRPTPLKSFHINIGTPQEIISIRTAYRGVCIKDGKILLIKTNKGDYKFPGGGQEDGENYIEVISREFMEETGYKVKQISDLCGVANEYREGGFLQRSFYYFCTVNTKKKNGLKLDQYEADLEFTTEFVTIDQAIEANKKFLKINPWVYRELAVLKKLAELLDYTD